MTFLTKTSAEHTRAARVYRGVFISGSATLVAALSHVMAGGNTPTLIALIVTTLISLPLVVLLTSKRFKIVGSFTAVALTQALFHTIFVYAGTGIRPGSGEVLPAHAAHMGMVEQFVPVSVAGNANLLGIADLLMWFSHGIATVITVYIVMWGEEALRRLEKAVFKAFTSPIFAPKSDFFVPRAVFTGGSAPKVSLFIFDRTIYRGPPAAHAIKTASL